MSDRLPASDGFPTLFAEGIRLLLHVDPEVPLEEKPDIEELDSECNLKEI